MAVTELTYAEKRQIRDYIPSLSNRAPGFDLASKLDAVVSALNDAAVASNVVSGLTPLRTALTLSRWLSTPLMTARPPWRPCRRPTALSPSQTRCGTDQAI